MLNKKLKAVLTMFNVLDFVPAGLCPGWTLSRLALLTVSPVLLQTSGGSRADAEDPGGPGSHR